MNWLNYYIVLAQSSRLRAMGSGVRGRRAKFDTDDYLLWGFVIAVVATIIYLLYRYTESQSPSRTFNRPRSLFSSLAKAHALDWRSRRLLKQLARLRGLDFSAQLFLRPDCFDSTRLSPQLQPHAKAIDELKAKLFSHAPKEGASEEPTERSDKNQAAKGKLANQKNTPLKQKVPIAPSLDTKIDTQPEAGTPPINLGLGPVSSASDQPIG